MLPVLGGLCSASACDAKAPPGVTSQASAKVVRTRASSERVAEPAASSAVDPGGVADNVPFEPTGQKIASIAWRTWVYTDTGPKRTRYGYLRAGAVVERRGPEIVNEGCEGGWHRINPRGFVCVGKGATLDLSHPVVVAASRRPRRGEALPYTYALSGDPAPHLYFRLPTRSQMLEVEGSRALDRGAVFRELSRTNGIAELFGVAPEPPEFLSTMPKLPKPYGVDTGLHYAVHAGQASADSGFAFQSAFEWEGRVLALTTELDLVALDRTKPVRPTQFHGVALGEGADLPAAFVWSGWAAKYSRDEATGQFRQSGSLVKRTALALTGQLVRDSGAKYWETVDGDWVPESSLRMVRARDQFPSVATGTRKWIDVSINDQTLVAYRGRKAEYVTLVSTGRGGLGDPETEHATIRGTFMIHAKHVSSTMDGEEDKSDSFNLRDVPFVQYFHKGFALHGTYWHDDFGRIRSHGCVNLAPVDAAWLFEWTDPKVPEQWHFALNKERGTVVYIHP